MLNTKKVQHLMIEKVLNQRKLAEKVDVKEQTISNYFNGRREPSAEKLYLIAAVLGTTVDDIYISPEQTTEMLQCEA